MSSLLDKLLPKRRRILVLTGGGARGAAQVGMLKALDQSGIKFDAIVGCSVGALNAVVYASEPGEKSLNHLESLWLGMQERDIFRVKPISLLRGVTNQTFFFKPDPLLNLIKDGLKITNLEETAIPVGVLTTELDSGRSVIWTRGDAAEILAASSALPGFFPPVSINGVWHIDGGIASPAPVNASIELYKANEIWVLDVLSRSNPGKNSNAREIINTAFSHALRANADTEIGSIKNKKVHRLELPIDQSLYDSNNFNQTVELIESGYQVALQAIKDR